MNDDTTATSVAIKDPGELTIIMGSALDNVLTDALNEVLKDGDNLIDQAMRVPMITSEWKRETFAAAGDLRKMIRSRIKAAEDLRLAWTVPVNKAIKRINSIFGGRAEPMEKADAHVGQLMLKWSREEEKRVKDEQDRLRKIEEDKALAAAKVIEEQARVAREQEAAAAAAGDTKGAEQAAEVARAAETKRDEVIDQAAAIPVADTTVRKARGLYGSTSSVRKVWRARLVSIRDLPDEARLLIMQSEDARNEIRKALKSMLEPRLIDLRDSGKCDALPGVEFFLDDSVMVR